MIKNIKDNNPIGTFIYLIYLSNSNHDLEIILVQNFEFLLCPALRSIHSGSVIVYFLIAGC